MTKMRNIAVMSIIGLGLLASGSLYSNPAGAASDATRDAASDAVTYSVTDAATAAERDTIRDAKRDAIRDLIRDTARDASRQQSPEQAAILLQQTYHQLLIRPVEGADQIRYGSELMRGERSVRAIVGQIARSPEFRAKWITPAVGTTSPATAAAPSTDKAIDNVYCALLGRHVGNAPVANVQNVSANGGFEQLIKTILDSKEYAAKFGEQSVPQPSRDSRESSGCPQASQVG
jgi:hypothetical protein